MVNNQDVSVSVYCLPFLAGNYTLLYVEISSLNEVAAFYSEKNKIVYETILLTYEI